MQFGYGSSIAAAWLRQLGYCSFVTIAWLLYLGYCSSVRIAWLLQLGYCSIGRIVWPQSDDFQGNCETFAETTCFEAKKLGEDCEIVRRNMCTCILDGGDLSGCDFKCAVDSSQSVTVAGLLQPGYCSLVTVTRLLQLMISHTFCFVKSILCRLFCSVVVCFCQNNKYSLFFKYGLKPLFFFHLNKVIRSGC